MISIFIFAGCYCLLKFVIGQTTAAELGAFTLTTSILSKILTARKNMETWILSIVNGFICILMFIQTIFVTGFHVAEFSMIIYYLACLSNDIYAYNLWKGMYRKVAINGGMLFAMRDVNIRRIIKTKKHFRNLHWNKKVDMEKNS